MVAMGFNDSVIHTDIISTANRTVTAFLTDDTSKVIYKDGSLSYIMYNHLKSLIFKINLWHLASTWQYYRQRYP